MRFKIILLLAISTAQLLAQSSNGTVTGVVVDALKSAIAGAKITVTNIDTGVTSKATSSEDGNYSVAGLLAGQYRLTAEKAGFAKTVVEPVEIIVASVTTVGVTLTVGSVNETVTVRDEMPLLSSDTATVSTTVDSKLLEELPFAERSSLGAVLLAPGVQGDPASPGGVQSENAGVFTSPVTPGASLSIGGGRPGTGSILVDGSDISLASYPRTGVTFSGDTMQQMNVQVNGIPAQYGRTSGGVINQTTRGGGNKYHGGANWQHTDPGLQAWKHGTHQAGVRPQFRQNLFGMSIGGPIRIPKLYNGRDRSFFYLTVEPARLSDLVYTGLGRVPTPDELSGNLAYGFDMINRCCINTLRSRGADAAIAELRNLYAQGRGPQLYYQYDLNGNGFPFGDKYTVVSTYVPIPGNNLSAQLVQNPFARRLLSYYPSPGRPSPYAAFIRPDGLWDNAGNNAFLARGVRNRDNRYSFRIDHALNSSSRLAFRYTIVPVQGTRFNFLGPDSEANTVPLDQNTARNIYLGHTQIVGSNKVNEFRVTYMRANQVRYASDVATSKDWGADLGLRPATQGFGFPAITGLPGGTLGSGGVGSNGSGTTLDVNFGASDDFSWVKGKHSFKAGIDFRALQMNRYDRNDLGGGTYNFSGAQTNDGTGGGSALASLMLGIVNQHTVRTVPGAFYYRWKYFGGYFQDDWKVTPRLTLNIGLRYSVETPRREKYNRQGAFDPQASGTLNGVPVTGGFVFSGENGRPKGLWNTNWTGFEPRFGFAYSVNRRTTVRGSYALLRAPLTGQSFFIVPDLNVPSTPITGNNGGVNPGQVNLVTNPLAPIARNEPLSGGPLFSWTGTGTAALPYMDTASAHPYTSQWSFSVQRAFHANSVMEVTYAGNKGTNLYSPSRDQNIPSYDRVKEAIANRVNLGQVVANPYGIRDTAGRLLNMTVYDQLRPYPHLWSQQIPSVFERRASSTYHALYVAYRQRYGKGLTTIASYTWQKSIDDSSSSFGGLVGQETDIFGLARPQNPNDLRSERSESTFNIPHRLAVGYNYEIPFGKGRPIPIRNKVLGTLVGGWNLAGMFSVQQGYPIWLRLGSGGYWFSQGGGSGNLASGSTLRPNLVKGVPLINPNWRDNPYVAGSYLNSAAFAIPGTLDNPEFGNLSRTISAIRSPITQNFDVNLSKRFRVGERISMTLRTDVLNVLNRPNFFFNPNAGHDLLGGDFNRQSLTNSSAVPFTLNANFGRLDQNNTNNGRTFRLGLRVGF
jgi:hypothetical protein